MNWVKEPDRWWTPRLTISLGQPLPLLLSHRREGAASTPRISEIDSPHAMMCTAFAAVLSIQIASDSANALSLRFCNAQVAQSAKKGAQGAETQRTIESFRSFSRP